MTIDEIMRRQNASVRQQGVVWRPCACGRDWPFPKGSTPADEYQCPVCCNAEVAGAARARAALVETRAAQAMPFVERIDTYLVNAPSATPQLRALLTELRDFLAA